MLEFLETAVFTRQIAELMEDREYAALQGALVVNPEAGDLIAGSGGLRKIRWNESRRGKGKRGGVRVIYYWYRPDGVIYMLVGIFEGTAGRPDRSSKTRSEATGRGGASMRKTLFEELTGSVREAGQIHRGSRKASRRFTFKAEDVRAVRARLDKTQSEFAQMIGVTLSTLQNWEQGRRQPQGPARALLVVAGQEPALVANALAAAARPVSQVSRKRSTAPARRKSAKRAHR